MNYSDLAKTSVFKAMSNVNTNKGKAFAHFVVALNLCPQWKEEANPTFITLTEEVTSHLLEEGRIEDFFKCFEQALILYPDCPKLNRFFAKRLSELGHHYKAFAFLRKATIIEPEVPLWQKELDDLKNYLIERWHFKMLNDKIRNSAYREAIFSLVTHNDSVIDIGCGSGILTLFAAEKEPQRLVAVDFNEALCNVASGVFKDHKCENIKLINEISTSLQATDIGGKVSVILTETFDAGFFGEGILQTMIHVHKQLIENHQSTTIIPKSAYLYICGVQSYTLSKKYMFSENYLKNLKFHGLKMYDNSDEPYDTDDLSQFKDLKYITSVEKFLTVDLHNLEDMENLFNGKQKLDNIKLKILSEGEVHAYAVWFELHLTDSISISTDPRLVNKATAWEQAIFHLNSPLLICEDNKEIAVDLSCEKGMLKLHKGDQIGDDYFPVAYNVIATLNDTNFINYGDAAAGAACVHLSQNFTLKTVNVLDLSPFPVIGLFLLSRGIQNLTCLVKNPIEKALILKVSQLNCINERKIHFVDEYDDVFKNTIKYHLIINNFFIQNFGDLNVENVITSRSFAIHKLERNGLMMPHKIQMMAKVIFSDELESLTRVDNSNVLGFKIAESMNVYQVGQTFISNISSFPYKSMSEEIIAFDQCLFPCDNRIIDVELINDGLINGVLIWFNVQFLESGEFYSTHSADSSMKCTVHLLELGLVGVANQKGSLLICCDEKGNMKVAVDLE